MSEPLSARQRHQRHLQIRREAVEAFGVAPVAWSADGRGFGFQAPISQPLPVGAYVRLRTAAGDTYLGQVTTRTIGEREGPELEFDDSLGLELAGTRVAQASWRVRLQYVDGAGMLLGRVTPGDVAPVDPTGGFENAEIAPATAADLDQFLEARTAGRARLDIGTVAVGEGTVRAPMLASGFDRHTFLCGQSGSGKTYALGVVLERLLLDTSLRMIVIDPNSDFVRLGETRSFEAATRGFGDALDRDAYAALSERYRTATAGVHVLRPMPRGRSGPGALRVRFSDLFPVVQGLVLRIDPLNDREEYNALQSTVRQLGRERYSLADIRAAAAANLSDDARRLALRMMNLGVAEWDVWAEADEPSLLDLAAELGDWRGLVLDVGGFGTAEEKSLVANGTLGALWTRREQRQPVLVVIDEAHNVCAQEPTDPLQAAATDRAIRIAGEGRKFGIYLLMSTQRPQKIHANVLSQCDNLMLMRMNSAADIASLAETFSFVPAPLLARSSAFLQGETLLAGKIEPSPLLARFGGRISPEGGGDVPATWAAPRFPKRA